MARFMVKGYKKYTGTLHEGRIFREYGSAFAEAVEFFRSEKYKVIVIVRDDEGKDHPENAGTFFLYRIIK